MVVARKVIANICKGTGYIAKKKEEVGHRDRKKTSTMFGERYERRRPVSTLLAGMVFIIRGGKFGKRDHCGSKRGLGRECKVQGHRVEKDDAGQKGGSRILGGTLRDVKKPHPRFKSGGRCLEQKNIRNKAHDLSEEDGPLKRPKEKGGKFDMKRRIY